MFINNRKVHQKKIENFVPYLQNSNKVFCSQNLKDFKINGCTVGSEKKANYLT